MATPSPSASTRYDYKSTSDLLESGSRNGSNFSLTAGMGLTLGSPDGIHAFIEAAATTVFTGSKNSSWAPVRFGIQF